MYPDVVAGEQRTGMARVARLFRQQDAHSIYVSCAALLLSLTLVVDLIFHRHMMNQWLLWALLVICLSGSAAAFFLAARLPRWVGIAAVGVFVASQTYFLSLRDDPQSVVASVQQLPVVAFYLGWFVRPSIAYGLVALCAIAFGTAVLSNPLFWPNGDIGVPVAVHGLLSLLFCFFAGAYLWLRTSRRAALDPLTGAVNRSGLVDLLTTQLRRQHTRGPCALVAIDFDDFKSVNDAEGHAAGDSVLQTAVSSWRSQVRARDVIIRTGGDEFVLVLPRTDAAAAEALMLRLQESGPSRWSFGIAESHSSDTASTLMARADAALFRQKRHKRERARG